MAKQPAEQIAEAAEPSAEILREGGDAVGKSVNDNTEGPTEATTTPRPAILELTKAYQDIASRNATTLTVAMQELAAVKSPTDFIALQQRLVREGVEEAVKDSQRIAQLTAAVFTSSFRAQSKWTQRPPEA